MTSSARAIDAWKRIVGARNVVTERAQLERAETATFRTRQRVLAMVRPKTTAEVRGVVRAAGKEGVTLYTVSGGKNWGYGSRVPTDQGCAVLDLRRMKRIVDFDEDLAYVTVEPGVTFRDLKRLLERRSSRLEPSYVGSTLDASLVGHALERGWGSGIYADRFSHVCGLEVVLGTGELFRTGYRRFRNAHASRLNRWGLGPSCDGLFSQSSLGVVTEMTFWLAPTPKYRDNFWVVLEDDDRLCRALEAVRDLRLTGVLRESIVFSNRHRIIALRLKQYPWDELHGRVPMPDEFLEMVKKSTGWGRWIGVGAMAYPTPAHRAAQRRALREALGPHVQRVVFRTERADELPEPTPHLAYWRKRIPIPRDADPDRDRCGVMFCSPVVPMSGSHVARVVHEIEHRLVKYRLDPLISVVTLAERWALVNTYIVYDREEPGQDVRAAACYRELVRALERKGYLPYRVPVHLTPQFGSSDPGSRAVMRRVKGALDPKGVLSPGRYEF